MMERDLFDKLKSAVGCEYVSDLHFGKHNCKARTVMKNTNIAAYPLSVLSDAAWYIFGIKIEFASHAEAIKFFRS